MTLVIDANVAVKWFVLQPDSKVARRLASIDELLIAPDILISEVANALWRHARIREIPLDDAVEAITTLPTMLSELVPVSGLAASALQLAYATDCSVYDCLYAVLARNRECGFITADRKFAARLRSTKHLTTVKLLDQLSP
jgi:predicted nucleic acid-binding protein